MQLRKTKFILRMWSLIPEQSEVNNHMSNINIFSVLHTIFFYWGGQKMDLVAPSGAIKCTLWPASRKRFLSYWNYPVQKLPNLFPSSDPGPIEFSTCGRRGAHGVARVETTSDYDRQNYFQILCCGRDIVVTILKLKCQKQKAL